MSRVFVTGLGAVSPAGWGTPSLRQALAGGNQLPTQQLPFPDTAARANVRRVPPAVPRPACMAHPRLRRTSPIGQYAVAAALEAVGSDAIRIADGSIRLGIIYCAMAGCVNFSQRFYNETLENPATASPVIFPETVFNAPASHLAALLGTRAMNYTLVGDPGTVLQGLALGAQWLLQDQVDGCVVIGAEEMDRLVAHAARLFDRTTVISEGAGALYLRREASEPNAIELESITDSHLFWTRPGRAAAAAKARAQVYKSHSNDLLCDGIQGVPRLDRDESAAWSDWPGRAALTKKGVRRGVYRVGGMAMCGGAGYAQRGARAGRVCERGWLQSAGDRGTVPQNREWRMNRRVILITGANGGLGRAIARAFLTETPENFVWLGVHQSRERAQELVEEFANRCALVNLDVTEPASWQKAVEQIIAKDQRLDVLVNNAGKHSDALLATMPAKDWDRVLQTNLSSVFHGCQAVMATMISQRAGRIINISSLSALLAPAGQTNYAAAKAGVVALTQSLAKEVARLNITVNAVCPGFVETEALAGLTADQLKAAQAKVPMRRFGRPQEIAAAVRFLACSEASYITGSVLKIDGGVF